MGGYACSADSGNGIGRRNREQHGFIPLPGLLFFRLGLSKQAQKAHCVFEESWTLALLCNRICGTPHSSDLYLSLISLVARSRLLQHFCQRNLVPVAPNAGSPPHMVLHRDAACRHGLTGNLKAGATQQPRLPLFQSWSGISKPGSPMSPVIAANATPLKKISDKGPGTSVVTTTRGAGLTVPNHLPEHQWLHMHAVFDPRGREAVHDWLVWPQGVLQLWSVGCMCLLPRDLCFTRRHLQV
jgi:hypothetical protein